MHKALTQLKAARDRLTLQQYRTLCGQVLAGDSDGALRGLRNILRHSTAEKEKEVNA